MKQLTLLVIGVGLFLLFISLAPLIEFRVELNQFMRVWEVTESLDDLTVKLDDELIVGVLTTLEKSLPIRQGISDEILSRGVGFEKEHLNLDESGNTIFYAHREQFFWHLQDSKTRDLVMIETRDWTYQYEVISLDVLNVYDSQIYSLSDEPVITLVTCYPFVYLSRPNEQRYVVKARLIDYYQNNE